MGKSLNINIHHLTRVEGHGNIVVRASDGEVQEAALHIVESPRFFESMLQGLRFNDAALLTSRICGICAVGHTSSSLRATEDAFGTKLTSQALALRKLIFYGEQLQSHILHVYFLVAPDAFNAPSVIPLAASHTDVVLRALKLKKLANEMCRIIAGRHVHPIAMVPGGFTHCPTVKELVQLRQEMEDARADIDATVELFATLKWPDFHRPTEYMSLKSDEEYAFYDGDLFSSKTGRIPVQQYRDFIHEKMVPHSTSKHCYNVGESYMAGALARFNNNYDMLNEPGKKTAAKLGIKPVCDNPFYNNVAQVVETVHCYEESLKILDELIAKGVKYEEPAVTPKAARGVGITEVPRGLLVHDYTYNDQGVMLKANCIIPTGQNLANIDADIRAYVKQNIGKQSQDEIAHALEMLVRAYDPCISCSVHLLNVKFV